MTESFAGLPRGRFGAIIADPAYHFGTWSAKGRGRYPDRYYKYMSLAEITALPVADLTAPAPGWTSWGDQIHMFDL
jgi:hypothetical protein